MHVDEMAAGFRNKNSITKNSILKIGLFIELEKL
jgi:hypothetical protein